MIILTPAQVIQVQGPSVVRGHALHPRPFVTSGASQPQLNGNFGLPDAVLSDPAHQAKWPILQTLPTIADAQIAASDWRTGNW